jgi:lactate permease
MTLFVQALPLLALVGLLASGRVGPLAACAVALVLTLPAAFLSLPPGGSLASLVAAAGQQGLFLAIIPVGVMAGGLLFHAAAGGRAETAAESAETGRPAADVAFDAGFLLGAFTEGVTGFGVGAVFAVGAVRRAGIKGAPAAAIGMLSQIVVPWGGLGPGTAVGAALADVPAQVLATRNAVQLAAALPLLLLLLWRYCAAAGVPVSARQRGAHALWLAAFAALLVGWHFVVPWELAGFLSAGPLLAARMLLAHPPRGLAGWRAAIVGAFPYLLLAAVLLAARLLWHGAPAWAPYADLPALPLNHAMVALWAVALALLAVRRDGPALAVGALRRMPRTGVVLLLFVLFARLLARAGVPQALAAALAGAFGGAAPYAAPLLAAGCGFVVGTNTGGNAALMPLQAALGRAAGLPAAVLPAVQNAPLSLLMAPQLSAVALQLSGGGTLARFWRLCWPVAAIGIAVGMAAIALG